MNSSKFRHTFLKALLASLVLAYAPFAAAQEPGKDIRLVLQLTVDGLRADLLSRYADRFGEGGFAYLKQNGTVLPEVFSYKSKTD